MFEPPRGKAGSEMETETFRSRIGSALSNRDYTDVETAWREYASSHPEDYEYLLTVASQLSRFENRSRRGRAILSQSATDMMIESVREPALKAMRSFSNSDSSA